MRAFLYIFPTRNNIGGYPILTHTPVGPFDVAVLKDLIEASLSDDKAQDIQIIDLRGHSALADYLVVASGTSTRHVASIAQKLCDRLSARGVKEVRTEGMTQANWVVVDTGDIIVHLFRPEVREFYNIEKMWSVTVPGSEGVAGIQSPGLGSLS